MAAAQAIDGRGAAKEHGMATDEPKHPGSAAPARRTMTAAHRITLLAVAVAAVYGALFIAVGRRAADGGRRVSLFAPADGAGFKGIALPEPYPAPAIDLGTADGGRFRSADARGKAVLVYFGYTRCPDVCPQTLARLTAALAALGADADRVVIAFVTVDPTHDGAAVVRRFLAYYDRRIVGLVGAPDELAALAGAFDIAAGPAPTPAPGLPPPSAHDAGGHDGDHGAAGAASADALAPPALAHSSSVILIDPAGLVRAVLSPEQTPGDVAHDVRWVLANR